MLKSKWARLAAVGLLSCSLPVIAAVNRNSSHSKSGLMTGSHSASQTTVVAHPLTAIKPTMGKSAPLKSTSLKTTVKPKVFAGKHVAATKKTAASHKPLHTQAKNTKATHLAAKKHPVATKKVTGNKLSAKPSARKSSTLSTKTSPKK